ncbi:DMT family transporter [Tardiphaga sp. vice352]|uniref:DMT family transporter n=1 Tax=unclassified Tardiphaga TaxID=2631404 RepID=UPI0011623A28|nr:DMT family transporter [Tardiphaga sp. vice278]QDM23228.1 DMT family transporter [Tardiphaga sp. vice154]QDM28449.1 DMT family transporter [Tardiphaga sp. vice304]QDM33546.1 DMT family transporter [Tardiphaga sp. vice352]
MPPESSSRFAGIVWISNQPYLLLSLTSLFWAGNLVLGRYVSGHVPPVTMACVRWVGAFLLLLPLAWPHLRRDWPVLRAHGPLMLALAFTGFAANTVLAYWGLKYTQAQNALLIQSAGPLCVALWTQILFGVRLTWAQGLGIAASMTGWCWPASSWRRDDRHDQTCAIAFPQPLSMTIDARLAGHVVTLHRVRDAMQSNPVLLMRRVPRSGTGRPRP